MSVPYQRISRATADDIILYDPAAERRAAAMKLEWDTYFEIASQQILYMLEFGWWPQYCEKHTGAALFRTQTSGHLVTAFDPDLLLTDSQTLKQLDVFKAVEVFYSTLVTDPSNVNEVDRENYEFSRRRFDDAWKTAQQLSNFYDLNFDGYISKIEENRTADHQYFIGDRRYF
jgi:hypothetical protein